MAPRVRKSEIDAVRRFNRFYTRRIGVLRRGLLDTPFSLTQARVLYELGQEDGLTATDLQERVDLDRGYLSRLLAGFERKGLVRRKRDARDRRRRRLHLTARGRETAAQLGRRAGREVRAMLRDLAGAERERLLESMGAIEGLLGPPTDEPIALRTHRPGDIGWLIERHGAIYWQEYGFDERFEALVAEIAAKFVQTFDERFERLWIAECGGTRVGAVMLVRARKGVAQLRLLLVEPSARGRGLGWKLVRTCVDFAREAGYRRIILWTQSNLDAARHLYERAGFERFETKRHASWGCRLVSESWGLELGGQP